MTGEFFQAVPYVSVFLIFFAFIFFVLKRTPLGENRAVCSIISVSISAMILWGIVESGYIDNISYLMLDLKSSFQMIILAGLAGLAIYLIYSSVKKNKEQYEYPMALYALSGAGALLFALPKIFSRYYLPDWILNFQTVFLIAALVLFALALSKTKKKS